MRSLGPGNCPLCVVTEMILLGAISTGVGAIQMV